MLSILNLLSNALAAITQAAKAFASTYPVMLAWKLSRDMESIEKQITYNEDLSTPASTRMAAQLRAARAKRERLYAIIQSGLDSHQGRDGDPDKGRPVQGAGR